MVSRQKDALMLTRVICNFTLFKSCIIGVVVVLYSYMAPEFTTKLVIFLVQNGPTPNFAKTSSCLCLISAEAMTAAHRQLSN